MARSKKKKKKEIRKYDPAVDTGIDRPVERAEPGPAGEDPAGS